MGKNLVIAIDGPAASGKSTTAKIISKRLGLLYIDSGAMYRAVTLKALQNNIDVKDENKVAGLAQNCKIELENKADKQHVYLDGEDITEKIRMPEISQNISPVAANGKVREILVKKQQDFEGEGSIIMDGRDIGTIVFPDADIKIFLIATPEARAKRRKKELERKGIEVDFKELTEEIHKRDEADSTREIGPLKKADDAIEVDNSDMSIEEQVNEIIRIIDKKFVGRF